MGKKKYKWFASFLLLFGFSFLFLSYFMQKNLEQEEAQKVEEFITYSQEEQKSENYIGVLEIPKINLKRGFYDLSSKKNTVNKNIQMIETSLLPDVKASNLILASHSGNSKISFFKNIYKLDIQDIAYVYYNNIKYTYELVDKYDVVKNGTVEIRRNKSQTNLTLITCDKKKKHLQNVYIFKLLND